MISSFSEKCPLASCPRFAFYLIKWRRPREKSDPLVPCKTVSSFHSISIFQDHCFPLSSTQLTVLFEIIMTRLISSKLFWHDISRKVVSISPVYPHNYYVYVIHKIKSSLVQSEEFLFLFISFGDGNHARMPVRCTCAVSLLIHVHFDSALTLVLLELE